MVFLRFLVMYQLRFWDTCVMERNLLAEHDGVAQWSSRWRGSLTMGCHTMRLWLIRFYHMEPALKASEPTSALPRDSHPIVTVNVL